MKVDVYAAVFLRRPAGAPALPQAEIDALQRAHLGYLASLVEQGHVLVNGPLEGPTDDNLRGLSVYRTSVEEARRLASEDPSVKAGRLVVEVFTWLMPVGSLGDRPAKTIDLE
jgi:uncharacterized protein YciI